MLCFRGRLFQAAGMFDCHAWNLYLYLLNFYLKYLAPDWLRPLFLHVLHMGGALRLHGGPVRHPRAQE